MKKELQRKLSFVLFVMAIFFAGVTLVAFHSSVLLVCIAGVLLLASSVYYVLLQEEKDSSASKKASDILFADRMAELMRGNEKAEKGVYIAVKKQHEAMEQGLERLETKLSELLQSQENAVRNIVLYNKENAKQVALSEREELRHLREELVQALQNDKGSQSSMSSVVEAIKELSHRLYEEVHENGEAILSELETTVDNLDVMKEVLEKISADGISYNSAAVPIAAASVSEPMIESEPVVEPEPVVIPEPVVELEPVVIPEPVEEPEPERDPNQPLTADDIAALFAQAEAEAATEEPEPVVIPEPVEEPEPERDPNQPLTADDIAALFAQAEAEAAVEPDPVKEEKPEDAFASSGVDLSDPNKTLSADDIAALFASMGN